MSAGMPESSSVTPKTIIAVYTVLSTLASVVVALRFYVRIARSTSVGLDDYLILCALVLMILLPVSLVDVFDNRL